MIHEVFGDYLIRDIVTHIYSYTSSRAQQFVFHILEPSATGVQQVWGKSSRKFVHSGSQIVQTVDAFLEPTMCVSGCLIRRVLCGSQQIDGKCA